jgi:Putative beta-barrel porin 2
MILPCRIHQPCRHLALLPFAFPLAACLLASLTQTMGQYAASSTGAGGAASVPLEITAGVDIGYDDHVIGSGSGRSSTSPSSFFTRENLVLTYDRAKEQTEIRLIAVGRFSQFIDADTEDKDFNVTFSLEHHFSTRLSFRADVYGAYQTEPNFQSNVGPENVRAPHFDTNNTFSVTYHWLPRLSLVTSYTFQRIKYESSSSLGLSQDRFQDTFSEELQFSLTKRTILIGEYRYLIVDYDTAPRDSTTHFALAGLDHRLTEHLLINVLGGESFRSFKGDGNSINPYVEAKVSYQGSRHSVNWISSYGVEQSSSVTGLGTTTYRSGLNVAYDLTTRINAKAGLFYHHSDNQGISGTNQGVSGTNLGHPQDGLQLTLAFKYLINKHFAFHLDYEYTAQNGSQNSSGSATSGYSRNRYIAGLTYTY